eukprot:m.193324 g.193324  ORF g.193324 m.193324 type:complete len:873 (-) comp18898_c0_seq1:157-2775(-)
MTTVVVSGITVNDLPDVDGATGTDPYVLVAVNGVEARTTTHWNKDNVTYDETIKFDLAAGTSYPITVTVRVLDEDKKSADDLIGETSFAIPSAGTGEVSVNLTPSGTIKLTWQAEGPAGDTAPPPASESEAAPAATPAAAPPPAAADDTSATEAAGGADSDASFTVTRREFMELSDAEQERFVAAIKHMMKNDSGPETSVFAKIAGYHGYPSQFCHHGQETFPLWHRAYLVEMERALQTADKELGNDGKIALPYWDWLGAMAAEGGPVLPPIIRREFTGDVPEGLVKPDFGARLIERGFKFIRSDEDIRLRMTNARVDDGMYACLEQPEHWQHASTRFRRGFSVEDPHNDIHVALGYPMSSVQFAAFHPIFFLHHCQVDRIYEKYLHVEGIEECKQEMMAQQKMLADRGDRNRWDAPLRPFTHPGSTTEVMPTDMFDTTRLGYVYDTLPDMRPMQMQQAPTYALFIGMSPTAFESHSYTLHVYVFKSLEECATFKVPTRTDERSSHNNYAGETNIFGGRGSECANCLDRLPFDRAVNLTDTLNRLHLSRYTCALHVVVERDDGVLCTLEEVPEIPAPVVTGPVFEAMALQLRKTDTTVEAIRGDVQALQDRLTLLGFYDSECDGWFGPKTEKAVQACQTAYGLDHDGAAGPDLKRMLIRPLNDGHGHATTTRESDARVRDLSSKFDLTYWVGEAPGYLSRVGLMKEVDDAFEAWHTACGVGFRRVDTATDADLHITFGDFDGNKNVSLFDCSDGSGGMLAHSTDTSIMFDPAERWMLQGQQPKPTHGRLSYELLPVLMHEVGHVLGFPHSANRDDVMFPFYESGKTALSKSEQSKAAERYKVALKKRSSLTAGKKRKSKDKKNSKSSFCTLL